MKKNLVFYLLCIFVFASLLSSCADINNDGSDTEQTADSSAQITLNETDETIDSTQLYDGENCDYPPKIRYNNKVYAYLYDISSLGEEWINEYTEFVYIGEAKYISDFSNLEESFATNYSGSDIKVYQCNEDCSVIAALTIDNNVSIFIDGNFYYSDNKEDLLNSLWR